MRSQRNEQLSRHRIHSGDEYPIYRDAYGQLDVSIGYRISDHLKLSLKGINLTDEAQESWVQNANGQLPLDYSETGRQYLLGLRYKF